MSAENVPRTYIVGEAAETGEYMVGDTRTNVFFLRGPASEKTAILALVRAANERLHGYTSPISGD